jgi:small subunit ribosomal protein S1
LDSFINQKIRVVVIEMDARKGSVVVSRRAVIEKESAVKKEETLKTLEIGKVYQGTVTSITNFGAFVDIGGIEGLLHISDFSWNRAEKMTDALAVGKPVDVKVLKHDPATGRIALGRKQLLGRPWDDAESKYAANALVTGRVTGLASFGAFVELEPGIEGLIHQSEFSWKERWAKPQDYLKMGDEVTARVLTCNKTDEKIALSLKRAQENPWQEAARMFPQNTRIKGTVTHVTAFGAFVRLPSGIEGLLRSGDISWTKPVQHPKDWVKEGQELELVVLEVNPNEERISLGLKQTSPDPYSLLKVGQVIEGAVIRVTSVGAAVDAGNDIEGFIPVEEYSETLSHAEMGAALAVGQRVAATITKVRRKERRVELSIRRHEKNEERRLLRQYQPSEDRATLGDVTEWEEIENKA